VSLSTYFRAMASPLVIVAVFCVALRRKLGRFWLRVINLYWLKGAPVAPASPAIR